MTPATKSSILAVATNFLTSLLALLMTLETNGLGLLDISGVSLCIAAIGAYVQWAKDKRSQATTPPYVQEQVDIQSNQTT